MFVRSTLLLVVQREYWPSSPNYCEIPNLYQYLWEKRRNFLKNLRRALKQASSMYLNKFNTNRTKQRISTNICLYMSKNMRSTLQKSPKAKLV